MVRLTFKTHHFIATTFKRKKALKIVIFTNLKCFLIFFINFSYCPLLAGVSPALPPVSGCVVAGGVVFP